MSTASDDFNRTNNTDLGANWTPGGYGQALQIVSNAVVGQIANAVNFETYSATTPANDQWSEVTIKTVAGNSASGLGPAVRGSATQLTCYYAFVGQNRFEVWKVVNASFTALNNTNTTNCAVGDVVRLDVTGSTLTLSRNGSSVYTVSDSSITSGYWGMTIYTGGGDTALAIDAWQGGDGAAVAGQPTAKRFGGIPHMRQGQHSIW